MPFPEWYMTMDCEQKTAAIARWEEKTKHLTPAELESLENSVKKLAKIADEILRVKK